LSISEPVEPAVASGIGVLSLVLKVDSVDICLLLGEVMGMVTVLQVRA